MNIQTSEYIGATGLYPFYIDDGSNLSDEIFELKKKDISHDYSISSIDTSLGTIQGQIGALDAFTIAHSEQISVLQATDIALAGSIATNATGILTLGLNKLDKSSLDGISVIYKDSADNVQLKYNSTHFSETSLLSGNTREFKLKEPYASLPSTIPEDIADACLNTSNSCIAFTNSIASLLNHKIDTTSNSLSGHNLQF